MKNHPLAAAAALVAVVVGAAFAFSCGGGSKSSGQPTPVTTTPTTTLPDTSSQYACSAGNGSEVFDCEREPAGRLFDLVYAAIDRLVHEKPQLFDLQDEAFPPGSGDYKVVDPDGYLDGVVTNLIRMGLCASRDPDDYNYQRILVKRDNGFSEEYDVLAGSGYIRRNAGSYLSTCTPATFPIPRTTEVPPAGSGCGRPYPRISRIFVKIHFQGNDTDVLDATPQVGPDQMYCASVGFTDGRSYCAVRHEGNPERKPCENWVMGNATDTGRPGPTWRNENQALCTGPESGCENHPENQYALNVLKRGTYTACGRTGVCGSLVIN
jgi:hypothetical protein